MTILSLISRSAESKTGTLIKRLVSFPRVTLTADNGAENTNGRIRRYIPKGISLDNISDEYIKDLEYKLNSTPRKCLGFLTPYEKMSELIPGTT